MSEIIARTAWPAEPYRGLDYYREADAFLFRDRDDDLQKCISILFSFDTKLLTLHGPSGCGKSSFLRAGLVPFIKKDRKRNAFLLPDSHSVIRSTSDPLSEIGAALLCLIRPGADSDSDTDWSVSSALPAKILRDICEPLRSAAHELRCELRKTLLEVLISLCRELPGRLVIILDQVEEVLTRSNASQSLAEPGVEFFHFLEELYVMNLDVRMVLSLRTEYYGWFRDELGIADDQFSKRPLRGGIQPYLLRSIRDRTALMDVVTAPTKARDERGLVYSFFYEDGLPEQIVDDLLQGFPASVTPALQVVCADLYKRQRARNGFISKGAYLKANGASGIVRSYITHALRALPAAKEDIDKWYMVLHSLVSRQGGGTVVSLAESAEELTRRAQDEGLSGDICAHLRSLCAGDFPVLRGEPSYTPRMFSLKHDMLAIVLSHWYDENKGAIQAKRREVAKRWWMFSVAAAVALTLLVATAFVAYDRGQASLQTKEALVRIRDNYAMRAPDADFRRGLLVTLANLISTRKPDGLYERFTGANRKIYNETLKTLRDVVGRTPWFAGPYLAVGVDMSGRQVALLGNDREARGLFLRILDLPQGDVIDTAGKYTERVIVREPPYRRSPLPGPPAVGFVSDVGPVVYDSGFVYFWDQKGRQVTWNILKDLPQDVQSKAAWVRVQFISGQLVIIRSRMDATPTISVLALSGPNLRMSPLHLTARQFPVTIFPPRNPPMFFLAQSPEGARYAYLDEVPLSPSAGTLPALDRAGSRDHVELDVVFGPASQSLVSSRLALAEMLPEQPESIRPHVRVAFSPDGQAVALKGDRPELDIFDLSALHTSARENYGTAPMIRVRVSEPDKKSSLSPTSNPFVLPPLALARIKNGWRAAWLEPHGIAAVETATGEPGASQQILERPLISGDPDGNRLEFTPDGQFLMYVQQRQWLSPAFVRLWDLRPAWQAWIQKATAKDLAGVACRLAAADGGVALLRPEEAELFQIEPAARVPCGPRKEMYE